MARQDKVLATIQDLVARYGSEDVTEWLTKIYSKWAEHKLNARCYTCESTRIRWVGDYEYECDKGHRSKLLGLQSWELGVPPWFMRVLADRGIVDILYRSRSTTTYGVPDEVMRVLERILRSETSLAPTEGVPEVEEVPEPTLEMFSDIVGLDDVKKLVLDVLTSSKPVHLLLVGPPSCIDRDEEVLTWNPNIGEITPKRASEIYEEFVKGSIPYVLTFTGKALTVMPALVIRAGPKKIFRVRTPIGSVMVSEEHTLFTSKNRTVKLAELKKGDKLLSVAPIPSKWTGYGGKDSVPNLWKVFQVTLQPRGAEAQDADRGIQKDVPKRTANDRGREEASIREPQQGNEGVLGQGHGGGKEKKREDKANDEKAEETTHSGQVPSMWQVVRDVYKKWETGEKVLLAIVLSEGGQGEAKENEYREQPGEEARGEGKDISKDKVAPPAGSHIHAEVISHWRKEGLGEAEAKPRSIQEVYGVSEGARKEGACGDRQVEGRCNNASKNEEELQVKSRGENEQDTGEPRSGIPVERTTRYVGWNKVSGLPDTGAEEGYSGGGRPAPREEGVGGKRCEERPGVHTDGVLGSEVHNRGSREGDRESEATNTKNTSRIWRRVPILEIEELGVREAYDLIVPYYHNFIVKSGIVVHNSAKTMILETISRHYDVPILLAGASTRAGLRDYIVENVPEVMLIDELDKISNPLDLSALLTWMESQRLVVTMATKKAHVRCPSVCRVIATANSIRRIPPELLSRFVVVNLKPYTDEEVKTVCINVLTRREGCSEEMAKTVAEAVVSKLGSKDPRDCVKIARLAKTPEDVDRIVEILRGRRAR